ncbi:MAG: HAD family hydrolase, partial [Candidatus Thiodiazotropha sp.]
VTEGIYFFFFFEILSKHRVSFFTQSKTDKDLVQRSLSHLPVDLIWSDGYLDVLPQGVNKRTCAEWIVRNILNKEQVLILAGNTETDQHLLIQSEQPSVRLIFPPLTKPFSELAGMTLARESFCLNSWKEACAIAQYSKTALKLR